MLAHKVTHAVGQHNAVTQAITHRCEGLQVVVKDFCYFAGVVADVCRRKLVVWPEGEEHQD
jgi:hypothetical protein